MQSLVLCWCLCHHLVLAGNTIPPEGFMGGDVNRQEVARRVGKLRGQQEGEASESNNNGQGLSPSGRRASGAEPVYRGLQ